MYTHTVGLSYLMGLTSMRHTIYSYSCDSFAYLNRDSSVAIDTFPSFMISYLVHMGECVAQF